MNERKNIELFRGAGNEEVGTVETFLVSLDSTYSLIGKDIVVSEGFKLVYYLMPFSNSDAILLVCIEENAKLTDAFRDYSEADLNILESSFPRLVKALQDGYNANLTNYALLRLDSNGHEFDCVATKVTGIDLKDLEVEWLLRKVIDICVFASDLLDELNWDNVSFLQKVRIVGNGVLNGIQTASKVYKIADLLNALCGKD